MGGYRIARTAADGVGAREWLEMGGEKKPLEISELGCADGCGRQMGLENCADGCGRRGCKGVAGNGWGAEAAGDQSLAARTAADGKWVDIELRGRLRTAWVAGSGWKWMGRRSRWRSASLAARTADGKWVRRIARTAADGVGAMEWLEMGAKKKPLEISELGCADGCGRQMGGYRIARTAADGVGAREWLEMGGEKKPLEISELGCADGCGREMGGYRIARTAADGVGARGWLEMGGEKKPLEISELGCEDSGREMGAENCADGCGQRGCKGVAGNGWGEEAAGDERAWLRGRLRTGNGCGEFRRRLRTAWVPGSGWKWMGKEEGAGDERAWLRGRLRTGNGC